jgi:glycosyltransferase involved in cell wall biosynthesis
MKNIKFSIITISRNAEQEIEDTMQSVLKQTIPPYEYILIDGVSEDNTVSVIEKYLPILEKKGIIVKFISEKDHGISDAFNKGIKMASGDVIGLINAGDGLLPYTLERLEKVFQEDWDIVYGKTLCIDKKYHLKYLRTIPDNLDLSRMKYNGMVFTHQSAFVRKTVYDQYGLYDMEYKYVMDMALFLHFYENGVKFHYVDITLVSMLAGGISSKPSRTLLKEKIRLSKQYGGYSAFQLYCNVIKGWPKRQVVTLLKHFPTLWYRAIGRNRVWDEKD